MEQQQQQQEPQRLEVTADELYAVIGQLTIENRVLRARLRGLEAQLRAVPENGTANWRDLEPAAAP